MGRTSLATVNATHIYVCSATSSHCDQI